MTALASRWTLASLEVTDLLGFQGAYRLAFTSGLQVVEAPNHTGKTSLAMALLWGLTGQVPKLARLNQTSFRLSNKHAGDNASTRVSIGLVNGDGRRMEIRRRYAGKQRDLEGRVEVSIGDEALSDAEADERVMQELGLAPASLEGCGVVLQDHRLKLITGKDSEISEVVNDMLGLEALSEVVPLLKDMSGEADQLRKEIESFLKSGNPLQRWQDVENSLAAVLRQRENSALEAQFEPSSLEAPEATVRLELLALAVDTGAEPPAPSAAARSEIERLRKRLGDLRMSSPHARELADVIAQAPQYETAAKSARKLAKELREHDATLSRESTRGELNPDALSRVVAECDRELEAIRSRAEEARGEQNLLEVAYPHLLHHPEVEACPLCLQKVSGALLSASVKSRLDVKLATELERLTNDERQSKKTKRTAEARLVEVKDLRSAHGRLVRDAGTFAESIVPLGLNAGWSLDADELFAHPEARSAQIAAVDRAAETTEQEAAARSQRAGELRDAMLQQEQTVYQPIEKRVNRVRDVLIPLLDAAQAIETHGRLRESAQERSGTFDDILREARDVAGRLKKIAAAVSEEEMASATAAVNARLPFVSGFFARVAGNPDFTGLDIQTTVIRNKVSYSLCATSTKMAALGDAVGHVLSEGDMSAAGMALLLGLASGESHQLGFLLLDDPAQGMDQNLQRNLARELAGLENHPQVIILTHQPDFAEALAANGAERRSLGHWEGGRLSNG